MLRLLETSLRYKPLVLVLSAVIVFLGVRAWQKIPLDAFPDVTPVQVNVYTEAPGIAAEDVERLITFPVETSVAGLSGVELVRSLSLFGLSYVTVYFRDDVDVYFARRLVGERLVEAKERIPEGFGTPVLGPNSSGLGQVLWYTIESPDGRHSLSALRTLHDWSVRPILRTASGVDDVLSWGGYQKQFQVLVEPASLIKYGLTFADLAASLSTNNRQVGGQFIQSGREQYLVRGVGLLSTVDGIGSVALKESAGVPVRVRDVARVEEGEGLRFGAITRDGREVVFGMVLQRIGEDAQRVVRSVREQLETVRRVLPQGATLQVVYDRTELIDKAIAMADRAMIEGVVLVIAILFVFLGEVRSALIVVIAIPMARLVAFLFMDASGLSANLMSLGGLIVGLGMTIDGPVVLVENAFRRLSHAAGPVSSRSAEVLDAAREVLNPIGFAVLIIIVVFLPLLTLEGLEGKLFKPLAWNLIFAMVGSIAITVTLIPVLAALLLKPKREAEPWVVRWLAPRYERSLAWALERRRLVAGGAAALIVAAVAAFPLLGKEFLPTLNEQEIMFRVTTIPSASLQESVRLSEEVEQVLRTFPQTLHATALIGRAERGETGDANYMEVLAELKPQHEWPKPIDYPTLQRQMQERLEESLSTAVVASTQPIQMRVEELISGVRAPLALKVYGEDLATLDALARRARELVGAVPGAREVALEANRGKPQVVVKVRHEEAGRFGASAESVLDVVQAGVGGRAVSQILDGIKRFDLQLWLAPQYRASPEAIGSIPLRAGDGAIVPLARVADIQTVEGYAFVRREQLQRYAVLQLDVQGRDVDGFVREASARLDQQLKLPEGYWYKWGGSFENQRRALGRLALIVPLTVALIFVLLYTALRSLRQATLILANAPFAATGGVLALLISGQYLSVPAAVGFIAVFGVAMLNGLVLVNVFNTMRDQGRALRETVIQGAVQRLRPVLMTALVEILGLLPFLLATGVGSEVLRPLATVVVGGLLSATALTLLLLPLLFEWSQERESSSPARDVLPVAGA